MQLSIIIVSYNVRYFLEQCLYSVRKAATGISVEILVADNASTDGTREYLGNRFPEVKFSWNSENLGFAKANNRELAKAGGKYILFLNPDTIVPEQCFRETIDYLDAHPDAGALGIRMLDGTGNFLPESRRSFPSPLTSLYKLTGLANLFPRSTIFAKYHMGHLSPETTHETDVLSGAFMMVRKKILNTTGGFDEAFFMYGEDIDLSYRIQKKGFRNIYFAGSEIIHFKGESTRKGTLNYVRLFYSAMIIFVKKHFTGVKAGAVLFFIRLSIWLRAMLTAIGNFIRSAGLPIIDAGLILFSFWLAKYSWNRFIKPEISYSQQLLTVAFPFFTVLFLIASYYTGLYDKQQKRGQLFRSTIFALLIILATYSLLPERFRFSRAILLLGTGYSFILLHICRFILIRLSIIDPPEQSEKLQTLVVATEIEYRRILDLLKATQREERVLGRVAINESDSAEKLTSLKQLNQFLKEAAVREIIFCENGLSFAEIIQTTSKMKGSLRFRISAGGSGSIVGSDSKNMSGETFSEQSRLALSMPVHRRLKRLADLLISIFILISFPIGIFLLPNPLNVFRNAFEVLTGKKTWVGYFTKATNLPPIRSGIIGSNGSPIHHQQKFGEVGFEQMDRVYARDYSAYNDIALVIRNYRQLGVSGI